VHYGLGVPGSARSAALATTAILLVTSGCPAPREPADLVDHSRWETIDGEHPFSDIAPPLDEQTCGQLAIYSQILPGGDDAVTVELGDCNHAVLGQPTLAPIYAGDTLIFRLWRGGFFFGSDGVDIGLSVGDGEVVEWLEQYDAPGDGGLVYLEWEQAADVDAGSPVVFYVSTHHDPGARHGANTLDLIELSTNDPRYEEE